MYSGARPPGMTTTGVALGLDLREREIGLEPPPRLLDVRVGVGLEVVDDGAHRPPRAARRRRRRSRPRAAGRGRSRSRDPRRRRRRGSSTRSMRGQYPLACAGGAARTTAASGKAAARPTNPSRHDVAADERAQDGGTRATAAPTRVCWTPSAAPDSAPGRRSPGSAATAQRRSSSSTARRRRPAPRTSSQSGPNRLSAAATAGGRPRSLPQSRRISPIRQSPGGRRAGRTTSRPADADHVDAASTATGPRGDQATLRLEEEHHEAGEHDPGYRSAARCRSTSRQIRRSRSGWRSAPAMGLAVVAHRASHDQPARRRGSAATSENPREHEQRGAQSPSGIDDRRDAEGGHEPADRDRGLADARARSRASLRGNQPRHRARRSPC